MANDKGTDLAKPTAAKKARRKRPTLSQQVKDKTEIIKSLQTQIQETEEALAELDKKHVELDSIEKKLRRSGARQAKAFKVKEVENEELIKGLTDKLLLLETNLVDAGAKQRLAEAQEVVKTHMVAGSALALLPLPLFDLVAISGVQLNLLRNLCQKYDVEFDEPAGKALLTSLVSGALPLVMVLGLSSFARILPGVGTIGGAVSMTVFSSAFIYATGQVFIRHFESGGTLKDFDAKHWRHYFRKMFTENRKAQATESNG